MVLCWEALVGGLHVAPAIFILAHDDLLLLGLARAHGGTCLLTLLATLLFHGCATHSCHVEKRVKSWLSKRVVGFPPRNQLASWGRGTQGAPVATAIQFV